MRSVMRSVMRIYVCMLQHQAVAGRGILRLFLPKLASLLLTSLVVPIPFCSSFSLQRELCATHKTITSILKRTILNWPQKHPRRKSILQCVTDNLVSCSDVLCLLFFPIKDKVLFHLAKARFFFVEFFLWDNNHQQTGQSYTEQVKVSAFTMWVIS